MKDFSDKIPADAKSNAEAGIQRVKDAMAKDDVEAIKKATDELGEVIQKMGANFYQQPGAAGPVGQTPPPPGSSGPEGEDVVDGEFKTT